MSKIFMGNSALKLTHICNDTAFQWKFTVIKEHQCVFCETFFLN